MIEQDKFLEVLHDILEIAKTQDNTLDKEEIKRYFGDARLEEAQYDLIYDYLVKNQIHIKGVLPPPSSQAKEKKAPDGHRKKNEESAYLKMYLKEISSIEEMTEEEERQLYRDFLKGREEVRDRLTKGWLSRIVSYARGYQNQGVFIEDLVQEGNMGLLMGLETLRDMEEEIDAAEYLKEYICQAMENLIDEAMEETDMEETIAGRMNLLHQAASHMAEDLGRVPDIRELSEYTHMGESEIQELFRLAKENLTGGASGK